MTLSPQSIYSTQLSQKRYQFYNQIKARSKQSLFSTIRLRYLRKQNTQNLHQLIQQTESQITYDQLKLLINFAKNGNADATIHLGNLIIEGILGKQIMISGEQIMQIDANCGYFQWLLLVLLSRKIFDSTLQTYIKMLQNINISKTKDQFRILNTLKCLTHILKFSNSNLTQQILIPNFIYLNIKNLLKNTLSSNFQISKQSYRLANHLFNQQLQQDAIKLINLYGINQFFNLIRNGLMSANNIARTLICQILGNNISCIMKYFQYQQDLKVQFVELIWMSFNLANSNKQKNNVKVQISYIMINFIQCLNLQQLAYNIERGLIKIINQLYQTNKYQGSSQIKANCKQIYKYLCNLNFHFAINSQIEQFLLDRINCQLSSQGLFQNNDEMDQDNM